MNNLLLFSTCYVSDICNHLRICPFSSFGFCPGCLVLGLFLILLTAEPLPYRATHSSTVTLYHFLTCQLIPASLLRSEGCFHLPVSLSPSNIAYASSSIFFSPAPGIGTWEMKAERGSGCGAGKGREMWSIVRCFFLCEKGLGGVPLDQSRPTAFLLMITNFTFAWNLQPFAVHTEQRKRKLFCYNFWFWRPLK